MDVSHLNAATAFSESDNSSCVCFSDAIPAAASTVDSAAASAANGEALRRLSDNLGSIFQSPDFDFCADASIAVAGSPPREIAVHRCVLSARSTFFREAFARREKGTPAKLELRELLSDLEVGYEALVVVLGYLYSGMVGPLPMGVCTCVDEACSHEGCRPAVEFMVQVLYASSTFEISELVNLFQRHLLDILKKVGIDDIPVILNVANICSKSCARLLTKCIDIVVKSDLDFVTLDKALPPDIVKQIMDLKSSDGKVRPEISDFPNKHVKRMHGALDSDDVELVGMLLNEGHTSLDDSYALHYAVAHCDSKITTELLDLGLADVNHRNLRGYTILHIAAMRKEPQIIVSLLTKGARPSDLTLDGRKALQISKRLTKSVDYYRSTEEGKTSTKDGLCIEILEQAERRDPLIGEASLSLAMAGDDLSGRLLYLENRVALARVLFPMEAKVAMDIAQVDGTMEFPPGSASNHATTNQRTSVELNETTFKFKEYLARMKALSRTVVLGKRFFPRCSEFLDKIMDDDYTELTSLGQDDSEERRKRFLELQDGLIRAFSEDKQDFDRSALSSSSSTLRSRK